MSGQNNVSVFITILVFSQHSNAWCHGVRVFLRVCLELVVFNADELFTLYANGQKFLGCLV